MEKQKKELIRIIQSIDNPKLIDFFLKFINSIIKGRGI